MRTIHTLEEILHTRTPIVAISSHEELKVIALLEKLANLNERRLFSWSVTQGLKPSNSRESIYNTTEFRDAIRHIEGSPENAVYLLLDAHPYLSDPVTVRMLKNVALRAETSNRLLVFVSPAIEMPEELRRFAARFSPPLSDEATIMRMLKEEARIWFGNTSNQLGGEKAALDLLLLHLKGLTDGEARRLIRMAIRDDDRITMDDIKRILKAKHEFLEVGGVLSLEEDSTSITEIGGLKNLKRWLEVRRKVFLQNSDASPLPPPKGVLLLGVQGAGKSMAAKAVASAWGLPLFRLDFGALYNMYHGETERNLREVLKMSAVMAPCVLWMDEIEKGIASDGSENDGGVSRRVLGTLLTWMAEREERVFLVATANDVSRLPPELLRKGRFDEIFFVDLPNAAARCEILRNHLQRRSLDPNQFAIDELAGASDGFSGSEIEQAILSALYEAHAAGNAVDTRQLADEFARTRPLSIVASEKIAALRAWAQGRTVAAD